VHQLVKLLTGESYSVTDFRDFAHSTVSGISASGPLEDLGFRFQSCPRSNRRP